MQLSVNFAAEILVLSRGCARLLEPHRVNYSMYEFEAFRFSYCNSFSENLA
jgi:hypothetical protein